MLSFKRHVEYYLPKDYNVKINGRNLFDQPVNNDIKIHENIQKFSIDQKYNYTSRCLLDYPYFKENCELIPLDLSKQQVLDADPR